MIAEMLPPPSLLQELEAEVEEEEETRDPVQDQGVLTASASPNFLP